MTVIVPTDWTSMMTAIGTVGVAVVAVAVALFAEWRVEKRVTSERVHAAGVLADQQRLHDKEVAEERALADQRLAEERKAADERLRVQLEHSDAQLREERQNARDAEQVAEAWSVEVVGARMPGEPGIISSDPKDPPERPVVIVMNHGRFTITQVDARFSPEGRSITARSLTQPFVDFSKLPFALGQDLTGPIGGVYLGALPPGAGMRLIGDTVVVSRLRTTYAIVRWTDHWGQRWEYKQGDIRRVDESDPWLP